jgi:hypothetical protein
MLHSEKAVGLDEDIDFRTCELKIKFSNFDNNFLKDDETEFTLLDPLNRPYTYLTVISILCRESLTNAIKNSRVSRMI